MVILILIPLILGGFFVAPHRTNGAAVIYDPLEMLDKFIITPLVRAIANSLENKIVNKVNGLISKIDGKTPSYITNWRNNILESEARGNDIFRAVLADTSLCPYFKNNLTTALGAEQSAGAILGAKVRKTVSGQNVVVYENKTFVPGMSSFQTTARCTLPTNFKINDFKKDFAKGGGWATWDKLLEPQNNPIGAFLLSTDEQAKQIATEKQAAQDSSIAGGGFKGQKLGVNNKASPSGCAGVSLPGQLPSQDALLIGQTSAGVRCAFMGEEVTPASILGQSAANALDTKIGRVGTAAMLTDVLIGVLTGIITGVSDRLTNFSGTKTYGTLPTAETGFGESIVPASASDPNFDSQVNRAGGNLCIDACIKEERSKCDFSNQAACLGVAAITCKDQCSTTPSP